jgi:hypothetical protein
LRGEAIYTPLSRRPLKPSIFHIRAHDIVGSKWRHPDLQYYREKVERIKRKLEKLEER